MVANLDCQCHILQKSFWYADLMLQKHLLLLSMLKTLKKTFFLIEQTFVENIIFVIINGFPFL